MHGLNYVPLYVLEYIQYVSTCVNYNTEHETDVFTVWWFAAVFLNFF